MKHSFKKNLYNIHHEISNIYVATGYTNVVIQYKLILYSDILHYIFNFGVKLPEDGVNDAGTRRSNIRLYSDTSANE